MTHLGRSLAAARRDRLPPPARRAPRDRDP
jgi:hypothetical protein